MIKNYLLTVLTKNQKKLIFHFFVILTFFFTCEDLHSQTTTTVTTPGNYTFTVPCDVTSITVQAWGAGGAGGGTTANNSRGGGGGAGGSYASSVLTVTPGTIYNLTVGAGGTGANSAGASGQASWFGTVTTVYAQGGQGGAAPNGGTVAGGTGSTAASFGTTLIAGANGGNGTILTGGAGGNGANAGGAGGAARLTEGNGNNGTAPGGGGGGAYLPDNTNHSGGNGGNGEIRITYTSSLNTYCNPNFTTVEPITNVTFAGINNTTSNTVNGTPALESFCSIASVMQGSAVNPISIKGNTNGNYTNFIRAYFDWDQNGVFGNNANEIYDLGSIVNSTGIDAVTLTSNIAVPATAVIGNTRMRIIKNFNAYVTGPCVTNTFGQAEDYTVNVYAPLPCVAPTAQPTALILTPTGNTISGSFTAAVPAADNYLVVINTTGTPPTNPVNGTSYAIGATLGAGNTVVDNDTNTAFTATGLTPLTTYYFFIYSFNSACTGGPLYLTTGPLTGNTTTLVANYCTPSISNTYYPPTNYIRRISFVGTLQDVDNPSSYDTTAPYGYEDFTGLATKSIQAQGEGVNIYFETVASGYYKAWVDWNKDGDFADAGEAVYDVGGIAQSSTTFGFVIPPATPPGNYRVRLRMSGRNAAFMGTDAGFGWDSCTTNVAYYGETEDYLFTVIASCNAVITDVTDGVTCGPGTVNLSAVGSGGPSEYRWYANETGGTPLATTATGSWTTPSIGVTTDYWVTCFNGCESHVRTKVTAHVNPVATITFTPSVPEVCGENNVLSLTASGDVQETYLIDEDFESGLGVMSNQNIVTNGAPTDALTQWQTQTSTFVPAQQTWYPAIASGLSGNNFAMATSDVGAVTTHNAILSPVVDTSTYLDLTLSFDIFHSRYYVDGTNTALEYITVDVSTNGGAAWTEIDRYTTDQGYGTRFVNKTYDLSAYINQPNFRVRIRYYAEWCDGLAIDNFQLYGNVPLNTAFDWTAGAPVDAFQDAACTIPYVSGTPIVTVYIRPNLSQLENPTYSFTATAILSNGCSVSQNVSINNKTSVWKGTNSSDWSDPNNWLPVGVPDINTCVIIPDVTATNPSNINVGSYDAYGKTLQVKDDGVLNLVTGNTLTIQNFIEVGALGTFNVGNTASLIQIDNVANTGNINMDRFAFTDSNLDYVYWSTPVAGFSINNVTPSTSAFRYQWIPTVNNGGTYAGNFGNWAAASGAMTTGKGYIKRGLAGMTTFTGVPNNGDISIPISRSTYTGAPYAGPTATLVTNDDDNWNLLGNPYPSAISADAFLTANSANLNQFVKLWTHGIDPSGATADPFYQDFQLNYSVADYLTYNALGGTQFGYLGYIGAGQGFFTLMNDSGATTENAVFNNTMRSNTYANYQFFKNSSIESIEKHRIWLKLIAPSGSSSDILVGYATDASDEYDNKYDAISGREKATFELYSLIENETYAIQGRSLPFNTNDIISIGVVVPQNGIYTIAISNIDGLFEAGQDIYLEDVELGIIHDLKSAPYTFTSNTGRNNTRFKIRYTTNALGNDSFEVNNSVYVFTNEFINVNSSNLKIKDVVIFDLIGRILLNKKDLNTNNLTIDEINKSQSGIIINVTLEDGTIKTFKSVF
ncbi:GEVED domain-containing protein [Flavobacterium okayamense]|uniref:T9SS sorting signal type C domain-containing protein n=1 Tax=Flavobacterium okayamense TaxID=2830782 RepID=A0ABM7S4P8_9FLAO|nr:GEVED domain-containing protein [Flavobacterium okayamense]BCY28415.1 hypothetical protein KK2020170_12830 [Flavobacterium okayamense]